MALTAAIIVPTRQRAGYLNTALATIAPQAAAQGAEVLVVDDGPDAATRAVTARHGARYLAHPASRGLNAARNTAIDATSADLLVFVDDDVAVRPGWLAALLAAAGELPDEVGVLTGPIHARLEDHRFPVCGREGPPVTSLDLGAEDTDAPHAWGANMAIRRSAVARAGRFDEARELYGDEQEWQARLRAAGGRIRYVAAAALDHRRAGDDARLRSLCRAAFRRGRASRRFDRFRGTSPPLAAELRVLAGCLVHGPRFRCANGPVMTAHSLGRVLGALAERHVPRTVAGGAIWRQRLLAALEERCGGRTVAGEATWRQRLRAALEERRRTRTVAGGATWRGRLRTAVRGPAAPASARPGEDDFLSGASGTVGGRRGRLLAACDRGLDVRERLSGRRRRLARAATTTPPRRRVLALGIERPGSIMATARAELLASRHEVAVHTAPPGDRGKFENLNALLAEHPADGYDWLLVVDDDVALPPGFLDRFLYAAEHVGLRLAQPAHRLHSHAAWAVTRRHPAATARETTFVEIGPVTAFHRDTFDTLLPFPDLRMGWGLDVHWAAVARAHAWPIGVVDATPVGHTLRPAADAYPRRQAAAEAHAFLAGRPYVRRHEVRTLAVHR